MKKLGKTVTAVIGVSFFILSIHSQEIETKDGMRIIHNKKQGIWGSNPVVQLELITTLGGLDVEDENMAFDSIGDILLDSAGNILILDSGNSRIQKLSPEGGFLSSFGSRGQGPGEFNFPRSLDRDPEDNIYVLDVMNRRIQIFSSGGKIIKTLKFSSLLFGNLRLLNSGSMIVGGMILRRDLMDENKPLPKLFKVINMEGKIESEFGEIRDYKNVNVNAFANTFSYDVDRDSYIYISFRTQNRIDKYSPQGALIWRMDRALNYDTKVQDPGSIHRDKDGTAIQAPKMNYVSAGISIDGQGRIWVITFNRQMAKEEMSSSIVVGGRTVERKEGKIKKYEIFKLEIFDPEGFFLGEIILDHLAHGIRIFDDLIFIWEEDEAKVYLYRIVNK